jgi:PAS domain S-box-containing protein
MDALVEGICGIDAEETITFCNDALSRMTGYSKEEIVGKNMHDPLHHSREDGSKYPRQECDLSRAIVDRKRAQELGGPLWKKDGSYIAVEYCGRPMQRFGRRTCDVATIRDLSEIELAKEALRQSEEQYRRILESMPDVAWTSDVQGGTRYVSPKVEALMGFTNRELYAGGTHLGLNQIHPEDLGRVRQKYTAEKQLLEQMLSGCLQVLSELLSLVNPAAFSRAEGARRYIHHVGDSDETGKPLAI